jgi:hypothetical protein
MAFFKLAASCIKNLAIQHYQVAPPYEDNPCIDAGDNILQGQYHLTDKNAFVFLVAQTKDLEVIVAFWLR